MTAAIYYHPEGYTTSGPALMGRNSAGESFLRGFLSYGKTHEYWVQVQKPEHARLFARTAQAYGRNEPVRVVDNNSIGALAEAGAIYYPGPGIAQYAFHRAPHGHGRWSLCGITHTTSSARAMDAIAELITAPVQPWDALICTSSAVKNNVERVLQAQTDYLKDRLGISKLVLPQLPVIPLGIHTQDFDFSIEQRSAARDSLQVAADTQVVLYMGRLSFHAKAHPLAMYQALQAATLATGKTVVLVECGWHANDSIANAFDGAARLACPNVRVVQLDGRNAEHRQIAWAGADVLCSLSDNIQETFGIVPIEGMAARLPVVVADWDGYRDTVREGIDGFRIPTLMPQAGLGDDLAQRHALEIDTYDVYCGHNCSLVAVDVGATTQALIQLFESPELRARLGESGRQRAMSTYDWAVIIPQYEDLWAQLEEIRNAHGRDLTRLRHPWPARMDPFHAYASYATQTLSPQTMLELVDGDAKTALQRTVSYRNLAMVNFAEPVLPTTDEIRELLATFANGPRPVGEVIVQMPALRQAFLFRSLAWLMKLNILRISLPST
ncbi:MAG: glycosyltransferase family 4 protein [Pseudomonadota bacterium]